MTHLMCKVSGLLILKDPYVSMFEKVDECEGKSSNKGAIIGDWKWLMLSLYQIFNSEEVGFKSIFFIEEAIKGKKKYC